MPPLVALLRSSPGPKTGCSQQAASAGQQRDQLRSSPGPKTGCSRHRRQRPPPVQRRCDPHPVRRPGAARACSRRSSGCDCCDPHPVRRPGAARVRVDPHRVRRRVAILTRSEDRVQPLLVFGGGLSLLLRSSPGPKTGCSKSLQPAFERLRLLRSSPGPKTGCSYLPVRCHPAQAPPLRSSPGPKTGCSALPADAVDPGHGVAILTRSEDRVQPGPGHRWCWRCRCCDPHPVRRPGAAPSTAARPPADACCDPHPVRRPGAAGRRVVRRGGRRRCCDPHPVRRPGAAGQVGAGGAPGSLVAILTRSEDRVQRRAGSAPPRPGGRCDPHPVRRPGAATVWSSGTPLWIPLRSSPGPKTGCSIV